MWHVLMFLMIQSHRIHGAAIYGNMDPINIPPMLAYIAAPWILWDWYSMYFGGFRSFSELSSEQSFDLRGPWGGDIGPEWEWAWGPRSVHHGTNWHQDAMIESWMFACFRFGTAVKFLNLLWSCYRCGLRNWLLNTFSWDQGLKTYVMLCWMVCKPRTRYPICSSVPNGNRHRLKVGWSPTLKVKQMFSFRSFHLILIQALGAFLSVLLRYICKQSRAARTENAVGDQLYFNRVFMCNVQTHRYTDDDWYILIYIYIFIYIMRLSMSQYVVWFISILVWSPHVNTVHFCPFLRIDLNSIGAALRGWQFLIIPMGYVEHVRCIPMYSNVILG